MGLSLSTIQSIYRKENSWIFIQVEKVIQRILSKTCIWTFKTRFKCISCLHSRDLTDLWNFIHKKNVFHPGAFDKDVSSSFSK